MPWPCWTDPLLPREWPDGETETAPDRSCAGVASPSAAGVPVISAAGSDAATECWVSDGALLADCAGDAQTSPPSRNDQSPFTFSAGGSYPTPASFITGETPIFAESPVVNGGARCTSSALVICSAPSPAAPSLSRAGSLSSVVRRAPRRRTSLRAPFDLHQFTRDTSEYGDPVRQRGVWRMVRALQAFSRHVRDCSEGVWKGLLPVAQWLAFDGRRRLVLATLAAVWFWLLNAAAPVLPLATPDSAAYIEFSAARPHGYSWFLALYRALVREDLAYLPSVQLAAYVGSLFLLAAAVGRRTASFPAAAAVLLLACLCTRTGEAEELMSDALYAAALISATAFMILHAARPNSALLVLAGVGIGIAIAFRTIGYALAPPLLIAAVLHARASGRPASRAFVAAALPALALYCAAATSQYVRHGEFGVGSAGGTSLLGKGLVLARPLDGASSLPVLAGLAEMAAPVRSALRRIDDPLLETLVARQYHEYLRWYIAFPELAREWPLWREASEARRARLAARLALAYIAQDPAGYARQAAIDFLGLWTMPRWLFGPELERLRDELDRLGELPFLTDFSKTHEGRYEFYRILPSRPEPLLALLLRTSSTAFWAFSIGLFLAFAHRRSRPIAWRSPDLLFAALAVHAVYFGTALTESAHERYLTPTWPLLIAAPILASAIATRRSRDRVRQAPATTEPIPASLEEARRPGGGLSGNS